MRRSSLGRRCFTYFLVLWVAAAWNGPLFAAAATVEQETARASKYVTQLQRSLMAIEDGRREAPRDRWDPQYVVDTVGIDPAKLYGFVRDNVGWVPYRGTLRGPVGVLMDRRGNALDQSLLLAKLLSLAGHETRLARAELPETAAGSLWASLAASASVGPETIANNAAGVPAPAETAATPSAAPAEAAPGSPAAPAAPTPNNGLLFGATPEASSNAAPTELAEVYELDGANVATTLKEASDGRTGLAEELESRVVNQGVRLLSQFGSGDANAQREYEQGRAFSALRDHWWVQVNQGGNWVDYDLMSPDGQPGNALATASATMLPDAVPEDQLHRVLLRVVAEQLKNGTLAETAILEHAFDPKELFGKRISLRHVPMMWPADWAAITSEDVQEKLFAALMTQKEWMPALTVGGEAYQQGSVRDSGDLNPDPKPKSNPFLALAFPAAGKVGRVADVFDDLLEQAAPEGGGNAPPGDAVRAEGELTAEWLEFTILVPGEQPKIVRRELFDILGPATRSSGDFSNFRMDDDKRLARSAGEMIETEILIQPSWPASEFVADLTAQLALTNKPVLDEFARDPFGKAPPNSMELFSKMTGIAGPAYLYSMLRSEVVMTSPSVFVDRPQVVAQHSMLTRAAPGELTSRTALDVVENGIGVDPFGPDAFSVRLLQGIADTNAEALALGEEGRRNVGEAFAQTLDNEDWTVLFPGDEKKVEGLSLAPDLAARILADLAAGYAVVSPPGTAPDAQRAGWWRIDPSTGATLGMGEQGWGAVLVEYAFYLTVQAMLAEIACMATAASEEERLRGLGAEEARQKVKIWARQCVSQALLQSITGMSTAWIENRFIHGASTRSLSRSSGARPSAPSIPRGSARPQSTAGHAPHPSGPRTPSAPRSPGPAPSSAAPHAPGTSPSSGTPSAPRSPAASTSSSSSSSSSQPHPQSSAPKPAPDMRKAPEAQKSAPKPPGDADHAVKSHTDRHMEARRLEQEAAQKYRQNPTPENLKHYETAEAKARDARWSELNEYAKNGGRGLPPGLRPKGQQSAPAGPGPVSGTAPTQPGLPPTQRPASGTAPTQPGVPPTERPASGTAQTQPGVPPTERPASGTAPTQPGRAADAAVSVRRRSCRADATFSESHGRECAAAARSCFRTRERQRRRHSLASLQRSGRRQAAIMPRRRNILRVPWPRVCRRHVVLLQVP